MRLETLAAGVAAVVLACGMTVSAHAQDDLMARLQRHRAACDQGDRGACVRFGYTLGEYRQYDAQWRREHPDWWWWWNAR